MTRTLAGFLLTLAVALAQKPQAFDVASIKPNLSGIGGFSMGTSHGRLTATNVPVRMLIQKGFHVKEFQLSGGPGCWIQRGMTLSRRLKIPRSATTICGCCCSLCWRIASN